jgi:hypothetical protein
MQAIQRLRGVYPEVGNLKRWDFRYHACSPRIARECDLILQDRRPAHGLDLLVIFAVADSNLSRDPFTELCAWRIKPGCTAAARIFAAADGEHDTAHQARVEGEAHDGDGQVELARLVV